MALPSNSKRKIFDGRYEILSIVGRGADSVVYHGRHITGATQEVAIKVLVNRGGSSTLTDKLRREALTLVSCRHKYVVRLDDFHSIDDLCYLSMEYAACGDLSKFISTLPKKRLSGEQVYVFLKQCLEAIDFVHATGVVHRDLKPENILVKSNDEIRVADFGLALLPGDEVQLEELQKAVGSFDYLAPEVLDGIKYDTISDLYSLGVCFYEAATGSHPFSHAPIAERRDARLESHITPIQELVPELPAHVAAVIATLMRFSSNERFQSASEALRALDNTEFRVAAPATVSARPTQISDASPQTSLPLTPTVESSLSHSPVVETTPVDVRPNGAAAQVANSDEIKGRGSNLTEKIDLERIKAIIARDTQRKTTASLDGGNSFGTPSTEPRTEPSPQLSEQGQETSQPHQAVTHLSRAHKESRLRNQHPAANRGLRPPTSGLIRYMSVATAFAILTVGTLYGYHALLGRNEQDSVEQREASTNSAQEDGVASINSAKSESAKGVIMESLVKLPKGTYPGTITGLFPGQGIPMALVANPEQQQLSLLLGLEGWIPVTVSTDTSQGLDSEGPTFRANGFILKFNQESSSDRIAGTVIDVVTGEAGTWQLAR